jgi:hypothetical protein
MLRVLLLAAITVGTATLTFALMALGSLVGVAYRSNGVPTARKATADCSSASR